MNPTASATDEAVIWPRVNRNRPEPLYHQVYVALRTQILEGRYRPGDVFPSEQELIRIFKVSRVTARRAHEELSVRGFIMRQQGRQTRVAAYQPKLRLSANVEDVVEDIRHMGAATDVTVLDVAYIPASDDVAQALNLPPRATVQWAVRVRRLEGVPFSYIVTHLPEDVGRTFDVEELSLLPLLLLLERSVVSVARAEQAITATAAEPRVAKELQIEPGAPLLHVVRTIFDQNDRPVEHISVLYRPDIYHYTVSLVRNANAEGRVWSTGVRPVGPAGDGLPPSTQ